MKQLVFVKRGMLEWQEAAEPVLQSAEDALVRPLYTARTDDKYYNKKKLVARISAAAG